MAGEGGAMRGYVAQRRDRFYAVIYEGIDPITGRERRRWHPAGTDRTGAKQLATARAGASVQPWFEPGARTACAVGQGNCHRKSQRSAPCMIVVVRWRPMP